MARVGGIENEFKKRGHINFWSTWPSCLRKYYPHERVRTIKEGLAETRQLEQLALHDVELSTNFPLKKIGP